MRQGLVSLGELGRELTQALLSVLSAQTGAAETAALLRTKRVVRPVERTLWRPTALHGSRPLRNVGNTSESCNTSEVLTPLPSADPSAVGRSADFSEKGPVADLGCRSGLQPTGEKSAVADCRGVAALVSGTTGDKKGALSPNTESAFSEHSLRQEWCAPRAPCWRSLRKQS